MNTAVRRVVILGFGLAIALVLGGCGGPPVARTTFLRSVDLVAMTDAMSMSFAADPVLGRRSSNDSPWVISIDRIVNHTNQIIPNREKWLYIARLRSRLTATDLAERRAITWIMPPERWNEVADELNEPQPLVLRQSPTHVLTGTFNALTNTSGHGRTDLYLCAFDLVDLNTGSITWSDAWEVKRVGVGVSYD